MSPVVVLDPIGLGLSPHMDLIIIQHTQPNIHLKYIVCDVKHW